MAAWAANFTGNSSEAMVLEGERRTSIAPTKVGGILSDSNCVIFEA
jgi:hypothetical protein